MGQYLDKARKVSEEQASSPISEGAIPDGGYEKSEINAKSPEQRRLLDAGWMPKVRRGKTIWASPQTGFLYSEEIAFELLRLDEVPPYLEGGRR